MKNILLYMLLLFSVQVIAQENNEQQPDENSERSNLTQSIEALKTAYITRELNLSPEEAQKFWPVYNGFSGELKNARKEFGHDDLAFEERKIAIMKRYREDFRKIFNSENRVKKCFRAEPEFHKMLRAEWQRRQNKIRMPNHNPGIRP